MFLCKKPHQIHPLVFSISVVFSLRPFSVQKVISTNMILVAVNSQCPCESRKVDIEPVEVKHNETTYCNRLLLQHYRQRPKPCLNYHPDVSMTWVIHVYLCKGKLMWDHETTIWVNSVFICSTICCFHCDYVLHFVAFHLHFVVFHNWPIWETKCSYKSSARH